MARPGFKQQLSILVERNLAIQLGSMGTLFLFLLQPVLIGYFIGLAWKGDEPEATTFLVMAVAAVWMGCMNACCAIVRERPIFDRERMFDLRIWSYLSSHMVILSVLCGVQAVLLLVVQARMMHLPHSFGVYTMYFLILTMTGITSAALGLVVSSFTRTSYAASVAVPILLIPQVIFSEVLLKDIDERKVPSRIEKCTMTKWGYDALKVIDEDRERGWLARGGSEDEPKWATVVGSFFMLSVWMLLFLLIAAAKLKWDST